jgi:predicted nucleic acid-binding protein
VIAVLDTSALLRVFIPDGPLPPRLENLLRGAARGDDALIAPELMAAEAFQVLHKKREKGLLSPAEWKDVSRDILALPVKYFGHRDILPRAAQIARAHGLTVYDALFLSLAEAKNAPLVTADHALGKAASAMGLAPA